MLVVKLTLCALGLLCMHILTGQTFLLCCCLFLRDPSSSLPSFPFAFLSYCGETLSIVDIPNVDNRTDCSIYTSYLLNICIIICELLLQLHQTMNSSLSVELMYIKFFGFTTIKHLCL